MTLDDPESQNRGFYGFFGAFSMDKSISFTRRRHGTRWWRGVVVNAFRLKRSYSTPGPVSTPMGDCLRVRTAIGFRASREHYLKFLVLFSCQDPQQHRAIIVHGSDRSS